MDGYNKFQNQELFPSEKENIQNELNFSLEASKHIRKIYKCLLCEDEFDHESEILKHVKDSHFEIILTPFIKQDNTEKQIFENGSENNQNIFLDQIKQEFQELEENTSLDPLQTNEEEFKKHLFPYNCIKCAKTFSELDEAHKHYETAHKDYISKSHDKKRAFKCTQCNYQCNKGSNLKRHISRVHGNEKYFECTQCENQFSTGFDLKRHISRVHGKESSKCTQCDFQFNKDLNLKGHISCVHDNAKYFKCTYCNKQYEKSNYLKQHLIRVHSLKESMKCTLCDYQCVKGFNLKRHILSVHERKNSYKCSQCNDGFSSGFNLQRHISKFHESSKCTQCDYQFSKIFNLKRHILKIHGQKKGF